MKTNVCDERFSLIEAIESNTIKPNSSEKVNVKISNGILGIRFLHEINDIKECFLVAYDKKEEKAINIDKARYIKRDLSVQSGKKLFWEKFGQIADFKYARLCIAMRSDKEFSYCYLHGISDDEEYNEVNSYIGSIGKEFSENDRKLMLYYSMAGQLSVKYMSNEEYFEKIASCRFESVVDEGGIIKIVIDSYYCEGQPTSVAWVSKTTGQKVDGLAVLIKETEAESPTRQKIVIEMKPDEIKLISEDSYYMVCFIGGSAFDIGFPASKKSDKDEIYNALDKIYTISAKYNRQANMTIDCKGRLELQIAEKIYPYMFSIVIAVYNTEKYLDEAFGSILRQKTDKLSKYIIGNESDDYSKRVFKNVYEVIMVNDGSGDKSRTVCQKYAEKYKEFVLLDLEKNCGVSYARNSGIDVSQGKYLNFMDSDDRISDNVFEEMFLFFEKYYEEIEALAMPSYFFDAVDGEHWLNNKFKKGNRIIDLWEENESSLVFVNATVYKGDKLREKKVIFDIDLLTSEDIKFNYQLLMEYGARIGVLNKCAYWYRRRSGGELSAVQTHKGKENYYTSYINNFVKALIHESQNRYGCVVKYVQHVIMQQLQWRLIEDAEGYIGVRILGKDRFDVYRQQILDIIADISDDVIMAQSKLFIEHKAYLLCKKYKESPSREYYNGDAVLHYGNTLLTNLSKLKTQIDFINIEDGILKIEGNMNFFNTDDYRTPKFFLKCRDNYIECRHIVRQNERWALGEIIMITEGFYGEIDISNVEQSEIQIGYRVNDNDIIKKNIKFGRRSPLNVTYKNSYYVAEKWAVKYGKGIFTVENIDRSICSGVRLAYEDKFVSEVVEKNSKNTDIKQAVKIRQQYMNWRMLNYGKRKPIWLISDRIEQADDNGEVFFWYMLEHHSEDVDCYFVIDKNSSDYERLKTSNRVIQYDSDEHKLMHLMADVIVSSQGNEYVTDPFYIHGFKDIFRDITYRHRYIFLQHGVIKDDLSKWLNRYEKDIDGFVTSAGPEYNSILEGGYHYSENEVWLTGLPRYDKLYHNEKKIVVVMPTWRRYILTEDKEIPGKFHLLEDFEKTGFYRYYTSLFNDKRLAEALERYDYQILVKMHPLLEECIERFDVMDRVEFCKGDRRYVDLFAEAELLVTDYSSTAMDFAYLNKPVIYLQFDKAEFFSGEHTYEKGYFDYENNGFGEVVYNLDSCVEQIIKYMENGCKLKEEYAQRISDFFVYQDKNNCERIYKKIVGNM